jgi:hypothetical protein
MKPFNMRFSDVLDIYVTLESNIQLDNLTAAHQSDVRDEKMLLEALSGYLNQKIVVEEVDFYEGLQDDHPLRTRDFYSFVHIFDGASKYAEVVINSNTLPDGGALVNECWHRFSMIKEVCQVVIRQVIYDYEMEYPNTDGSMKAGRLFHNLVKYKFSIADFDSEGYPADVKVENAAEIIAALLFYPVDKMIHDRKTLENGNHLEENGNVIFGVFDNPFYDIALKYKIPERYVRLFLTSPNLDQMNNAINGGDDDDGHSDDFGADISSD